MDNSLHKVGRFLFTLFFISAWVINPSYADSNLLGSVNLCLFEPQVDDQIQEMMNQSYIPSTVTAVVRNTSIIWTRGYGEKPETDLIYMTGSVTKTITATAIFKLYEQDLIDLDDDVNEYLPFTLRHPNFINTPITIRMLLLHRSGLSKDTNQSSLGMAQDLIDRISYENPYDWLPYPYWIEEHLTPNGTLYNPEAWTSYEPGTVRENSNMGYEVLGYALEGATGIPIWQYIRENIFDPLEMSSTGYNISEFDESQLAIPYFYNHELNTWQSGNVQYPHYNEQGYASGAIRSNVFDLAKFLLIHMHNGISNGVRILDETTLRTMHQMEASWVQNVTPWGGWGGTEGDVFGFHAKAYSIHNGATNVPYAVITFVNQGHDDAREACFSITKLLIDYVNEWDITATNCTSNDTQMYFIVISGAGVVLAVIVIVVILRIKRQRGLA